MKHAVAVLSLFMSTTPAWSQIAIAWNNQFGAHNAHGVAVNSTHVYAAGSVTGALTSADGTALSSAGGVDAYLRKFDLNGVEIWTRQFGGSGLDVARGVAVDAYGVFVVGAVNGGVAGGFNAIVRKYDLSGYLIWEDVFGTPGDDVAYAVVAYSGVLYVCRQAEGVWPGNSNSLISWHFVTR
ncbi:MAG: hypothetical protein ACREUU_21195 [Gammaproteobacteria bacterium]